MTEKEKLFGTNGIRGEVNKDMTADFAAKIGYAIGTFFNRGHVLVGYDGRVSSPMLAQAIISGLAATGCNVYDAGMAPTPAIQLATKHHKMDGGVIITASHNPPEYNGVKVLSSDGVELSRQQESEIEAIYFQNRYKLAEWRAIGITKPLEGIVNEYIEAVYRQVDAGSIAEKGFTVVLDPANGVGALAAPYLLRRLGCRVITLNANIDGTFPSRPSEPRPENLQTLSATVKAVKADLGVAYDGDADRAIFVDEKGEVHWGDRTFALIAKNYLAKHPKESVVTPVSSSQLIEDVARQAGAKVVWTRVGSVIVSHTMKKTGAKLGGEENGGVFYGPHQPVRDGAMTTALILEIMARENKPLSQLLSELPRYYVEKEKINCPNKLKTAALKALLKQAKTEKKADTDTTDGLKIRFPDKSSILIRPSGTEPVYRFYAEAKTMEKARKLVQHYSLMLSRIVKQLNETY